MDEMIEKTHKLGDLNDAIKEIGLLIDIQEYLKQIGAKSPTQIYDTDGVFSTFKKRIKNSWNASSYNEATTKFNEKINEYNSLYTPSISNLISQTSLATMIENVSYKANEIAKKIFANDRYGLGKLQYITDIIMNSSMNFDHVDLIYQWVSKVLNENNEYIGNIKKDLLKAYQSISIKNVDMTKIRLTAGLLTGLVVLTLINPAIGGLGVNCTVTTGALGGLFFGTKMAESVLLLCGATALTYAALEVGLTQGDKLIQRKRIREEFRKLNINETAVMLAKTILSIQQISKYRTNDEEAEKIYEELIDEYIDIKSDTTLIMFLSEESKLSYEKNKVFQKADDYLCTKLQIA